MLFKDSFVSRKALHILISIGVIFASYFISKYEMISLCIVFIILNTISNFLRLSKYEEKGNFGTILFPLSVLISSIFYYENKNLFFLSLFPMFFSDPIAATMGKKISKLHFEGKTLIGSFTFFILTSIVCIYFSKNILFSLIFSYILTLVELVSRRGTDNFLIVLFAIILMNVKMELFLSAIFFAFLIAIISVIFNWLDIRGSIGTFLIGSIILYSGGFKWTIPMLIFLIFGSLLSKLNEKKSKRNLYQVLANGSISFILSVINIFYPSDLFYFIHLCAISSMASDTFSTEIGMKFSNKAYFILNFKEVEKGISGGVSFVGFIGGILGSLIISIFHSKWVFVFLIGILGNIVDSIIGATLENKGLISNNLTNFLASLVSSIVGFLLYYATL